MDPGLLLISLAYYLGMLVLLFATIWVVFKLSPWDDVEEIRGGNIAVAIFDLAIITAVMGLLWFAFS